MKIYKYVVDKEFVTGPLEGHTISDFATGYLIDYEEEGGDTPDQMMTKLFPETEEAVFNYNLDLTNNIQFK